MNIKNKYDEFYKNIIFDRTNKDNYVELRCFNPQGEIYSRYFQEPIELIRYIDKYKTTTNIYVGINPRKEQGRKNQSVAKLQNMIFDLEMSGKKVPLYEYNNKDNNTTKLVESEYLKKLKRTANFVQEYLQKEYSLDISAVVTSGRGMHIYIRINEEIIEPLKYKNKYKILYNKICDYINKNNPYAKEIKVDKMCSDAVRILGAPGSINTKYPEYPIREILYLNTETDNKLLKILKNIKEYQPNRLYQSTKRVLKKDRYIEQTIFDSPEFKVFTFKPKTGTQINNRLRLALRLLMARDGCTNYDEIAQAIADLGYPYKDMSFIENEYPDYKYSENILNNYVFDNFEWSIVVGFKIPYKLKEELESEKNSSYCKDIKTILPDINQDWLDDRIKNIDNYKTLVEQIKMFNNIFFKTYSGKRYFYTESLKKNILNNIPNEKLKEFIIANNLIERLQFIY